MSDPLALAREALAGQRCWIVGGAVRDRPAPVGDLDLIVEGDVAAAAAALARAGRAPLFELSDEFGAWRVVGHGWQADLNPLRGGSLEADLALRDFTVNAIAEPLEGGPAIDPFDGAGDLAAGVLRLVSADALRADPLRALRLVRFACELSLAPDEAARAAAREAAPALAQVAAERVYAELRRVVGCARVLDGLSLAASLGVLGAVLPELEDLHGVSQSRFHHLDVYDHTFEVLAETVALEADPGGALGDANADGVRAVLAAPLGDEMSRGTALRFGALLHDIAKPATRVSGAHGRVGFPGHDEQGAAMTRSILGRLRASGRVCGYVASLVRHHLRLGFLVHSEPVGAREVYAYLDACDEVAVDVTVLSVADRLATRGDRAQESIAKHLELARKVTGPALAWHRDGRPAPLVRGDALARALGISPGPRVGELLAELAAAQYAGEVASAAEAVEYARGRLHA